MKIIKSKFKKSWKWDYCIYRNRKSTWSWMFFLSSSIYIIIIIIPKRQKKGQSDHKAIWWAIWACCRWAWPLGQGNILGLSTDIAAEIWETLLLMVGAIEKVHWQAVKWLLTIKREGKGGERNRKWMEILGFSGRISCRDNGKVNCWKLRWFGLWKQYTKQKNSN